MIYSGSTKRCWAGRFLVVGKLFICHALRCERRLERGLQDDGQEVELQCTVCKFLSKGVM